MPENGPEGLDFLSKRRGPEVGEMDWQTREVKGIWEGTQYVNKIAKARTPIDQDVVCGIHRRVMKYFAPEVAGRYRDFNVAISGAKIMPPHWSDVREQMFLFSENFQEQARLVGPGSVENVINLASLAHCELVRIHPFADGNGRTARLLVDLILKRYGMYPLTDWGSEGDEYIDVLRESDKAGTHKPLARFVARKELSRHEEIVRGVARTFGEKAGASANFRNMIDRIHELARMAGAEH